MKTITLLLLIPFFLSACDMFGEDDPQLRVPPRELSASEKEIVRADNSFGISLFNEVKEEDKDAIFVSPLSVSMALGMTLNGASSDTYEELQNVLEKAGLSNDSINLAYKNLIELLENMDPSVTMNIANSIWYKKEFSVLPAFEEVNRTHFFAEISALDFADPAAKNTINDWVSDKTEGLIPTIIEEIPREAVMYLVNALYFKGNWMYAFDADETVDKPFKNLDQSISDLPTMHMETDLPYAEIGKFRAVDIPYGDSLYSMVVLLPGEDASLDQALEGFTHGAWEEIIDALDNRQVRLELPRFSLSYSHSLKDPLKAMGLQKAFEAGQADFSAINPESELFISNVLHKTFVDVNEQGTEAAAVTAVEIGITSIGPEPGKVFFQVNQPFVFAIRESHSNSILFIGRVNKLG